MDIFQYPNRTSEENRLIETLYRKKQAHEDYAAYCTATVPLVLQTFTGRWDKNGAIMKCHTVPAGTKLKIVMVSRVEDFGLTDDLAADHGYGLRLPWDTKAIECIREQP